MNRLSLAVLLACGLVAASPSVACADDAPALVDDGPVTVVDAGPGSAVTPAPSASVPDPAEHPAQAWDDAKAAKKGGWPLLVYFCLVALTKALAYSRDKLRGAPVVGWIAARLAVGKTAMIVAGIGALAAAGYDVLVAGGSATAALMASGVALAGALHSTTQPAKAA